MAASNTIDQNKTMDLSQVISEAHESLHGNISPTAAVSFVEPNSLHCSKSIFQRPPVPPYPLQSTPVHEPQRISQSPMPCPQISSCNSGLPISTATLPINSDPNVAIQMMFSNMSIMNQKLESVSNSNIVIYQQLQKLDLLEDISKKLQIFEKNMTDMKIEINNIKATQEQQAHTLAKEENHHYIIEDRVKSMEQVNTYLENENFELKEQFLRLQTHSMKYNLIFSGITEQDNESKEDTESVIKNFIETELEIRDANTISFQNVHRLRPRNDGKPRNIIAKFSKYDDHQRVIRVVPAKLRHKSRYSVQQQYPAEINDRRRALVPKLKEFQRARRNAKIVYDQLIVDGQPYEPPPRGAPPDQHVHGS
ncbi:unnamed protein product [Mytilus edulis]|uniref:Uncharacterized protein n=1 Tax=Mytilus edulis TaxID=6550 RepID=A0A8S3R5K8_MYTED|nr:unnamed protein product [Mytilus edulis]